MFKKIFGYSAIAASVVTGCYAFASPWLALRDLTHAFEDQDTRKIEKLVDFSELREDNHWNENKESIEELEKRIQTMVDYIEKLDAKKIAVVSHSSFLGQYLFKKIGDEHNELEHCHPFGPYSINRYKL